MLAPPRSAPPARRAAPPPDDYELIINLEISNHPTRRRAAPPRPASLAPLPRRRLAPLSAATRRPPMINSYYPNY